MRHRGYRVTRYADDWVVTCRTRREAEHVLREATKILTSLAVELNRDKTRIVHVSHGFEFLGYKIKRGTRPLQLSPDPPTWLCTPRPTCRDGTKSSRRWLAN